MQRGTDFNNDFKLKCLQIALHFCNDNIGVDFGQCDKNDKILIHDGNRQGSDTKDDGAD